MSKMTRSVSYSFSAVFLCLPVSAATIYVDAGSTCHGVCGSDCGGSWVSACRVLQDGIDAASSGDEIWAAAGSYEPIRLRNGVTVYGGFGGNETEAAASDPRMHKTYIDGGGSSRAVRSVATDASTVLRGFIIRNGAARGLVETGGGLYIENSRATFVQCVFAGNSADYAGGAVAIHAGGAPTFVNCQFSSNGGAADHSVPLAGGAVFSKDAEPVFVNCLFHGNRAAEGGAILALRGKVTLQNCTLTDNEATVKKGGALFDRRGNAVLRNCIVWNNRALRPGTSEIFNDASLGRVTDVAFSNVQGGWAGTGNLHEDPLFVDASNYDYRLRADSPCLDTGQDAALPADVADLSFDGNVAEPLANDLDLEPRISGNAVDMGAYEHGLR